MLKMLDKYPIMVDIKGGRVPFLFSKIYITSNVDPKDWYPNVNE